jgi:hypothetical protein
MDINAFPDLRTGFGIYKSRGIGIPQGTTIQRVNQFFLFQGSHDDAPRKVRELPTKHFSDIWRNFFALLSAFLSNGGL